MVDLHAECDLFIRGQRAIAGVDEVGRGAWAGPVTAAAVILPHTAYVNRELLWGVTDSKQLSARQREYWDKRIRTVAVAVGVSFVPPRIIDSIGIAPAAQRAMVGALDRLTVAPDHVIVDAFALPRACAYAAIHDAVVSADQRCLAVAAASICAKVARDRLMRRLHVQYPSYGFSSHKGYGTHRHREQLRADGPTPLHRWSFAPVRDNARCGASKLVS